MKYLVTGGSGFIGTNLIECLTERNDEILNLDIADVKLDSHRKYWSACDIMDRAKLIKIVAGFEPTHVIHLAARTDTEGKRSLEDYLVNTQGTSNLLDAIKLCGTVQRLIITSTQFVHQFKGFPKHDEDFEPYTVYGESKMISEKLTRSANLSCSWTIIRPTNVWGPWHLRYPYEFWRVIGKGLYFHPGGAPVTRSYGYVGNIVFQMTAILDAPLDTISGQVYYVGDKPLDLLEWVNCFSVKQTGKKVKILPRWMIRCLGFVGDILLLGGIKFPITSTRYLSMTSSNTAPMEKTLKTFGSPPYSLDHGVEETVNWLKQYHPDLVKMA